VEAKARVAGAEWWLEGLADLVASLEWEWGVSVGEAYEDASEAFVAPAVSADGSQAVVKLVVPQDHDGAGREITVLGLADGDGCARLIRADPDRGALLLERLGPSLAGSGLSAKRRQAILVDLATRVWRPAPGVRLPTGAEQARRLVAFIERRWEELDRPCSERAMAYARSCAEERARAHDDDRAVLVHGDVHQWNALRGTDGYKLVDPDGLLAEAEYDLGVIMREDPLDLDGDGHGRSRWLAERTGLDEHAIWQWGAAERVSTGLLLVQIGLEPVGRQMLDAAERVTP
jgi:streptomycin 6-kinase